MTDLKKLKGMYDKSGIKYDFRNGYDKDGNSIFIIITTNYTYSPHGFGSWHIFDKDGKLLEVMNCEGE